MNDKQTIILKPSEQIRAGIPYVTEKRDLYLSILHGVLCGCALGTAIVGALGQGRLAPKLVPDLNDELPRKIAEFNPAWKQIVTDPQHCRATHPRGELYLVVSDLHFIAGWSRERIADWLESIGL